MVVYPLSVPFVRLFGSRVVAAAEKKTKGETENEIHPRVCDAFIGRMVARALVASVPLAFLDA